MDDIHIGVLFAALVLLIGCSAFFSSSETGLMTLNRYRLRHRAKAGDWAAQRTSKLLERPDRLIGIILLGNNFVNILASAIATVIAIHFLGEAGILVSTIALTLILLVFGEGAPKTLAALHPERIAFPASAVLAPLLKAFYPLVWLTNVVANGLLRLFRITIQTSSQHAPSAEELRTVVLEAGVMIPKRHQTMLLGILELEEITVNDIMVPRNELEGIDLEDEWEEIVARLNRSPYSRLLVYRDSLEQIVGFLHLRKVLNLMIQKPDFTRVDLENLVREPYFIPEGTSLTRQLLNFQQLRRRMGLVVDEYGDVLGLVTLEDILEEIVGEFTTDFAASVPEIHPQPDGTYVIDGLALVRDINRALGWDLPTLGPKTLNGLVLEHLESLPENNLCLTIDDYRIETLQIKDNVIKNLKVTRSTPPAPVQSGHDGVE